VCSYQWLNVSEPAVSRRSTTCPWRFSFTLSAVVAWASTPPPPMSSVNVWRRTTRPSTS
jgi:hypothetical protein